MWWCVVVVVIRSGQSQSRATRGCRSNDLSTCRARPAPFWPVTSDQPTGRTLQPARPLSNNGRILSSRLLSAVLSFSLSASILISHLHFQHKVASLFRRPFATCDDQQLRPTCHRARRLPRPASRPTASQIASE